MNVVGIDTSYMTFALSIPVFGQIVMGAILAGVGISILVLGHRKYGRRNKR